MNQLNQEEAISSFELIAMQLQNADCLDKAAHTPSLCVYGLLQVFLPCSGPFCKQEEEGFVSQLQQVATLQSDWWGVGGVDCVLHCDTIFTEDFKLPCTCCHKMFESVLSDHFATRRHAAWIGF